MTSVRSGVAGAAVVVAFAGGGMLAGGGAAAAEPTGCGAVNLLVLAASYCSGGTGEHRVVAGTPVARATGPWAPAGVPSIVVAIAPAATYETR